MKKYTVSLSNAIRWTPLLALAFVFSPPPMSADTLTQINLASDVPGLAHNTDPNLKNPWGVSFSPTSPFWVSNQASGTSTLYDGAGNSIPLIVNIPGGTPPATGPTGQVENGTTSFALPNGSGPAHFIFDTLNGTIAAWNSPAGGAVQVASSPGSVFTGLAEGQVGTTNYLYAADNTGHIRVYDSSFKPATLAGNFSDPSAPAGYTPFNIELVGSELYVTYAKVTAMGTGLPGGFIDAFTTSGVFVRRIATGGALYAPWGMAVAPGSFGSFANDLLVGNFGNGEILAYNSSSGAFAGTLDGSNGKPIVNDFLWSLDFRTGGMNVDPNALYFTAGINNQKDGLFGEIVDTPEPQSVFAILLGGALLFSFRRLWVRSRSR